LLAFKVTVIVAGLVPLATTELGDASTVELPALAAGFAVKLTVAVWLTVTVSVTSVAVNTGVPTVVDFTVKVTTPDTLEVPEAAEIVSVAPRLDASVTDLPGMGALLPSRKVTVRVEVLTPSARCDVGEAVTVEVAAFAGGTALNVTLAVAVITMLSVTSVAVKTGVPGVAEVTVKVTTPEPLETPEAAAIVSIPGARFEASVTVLPATATLPASRKVTVIVEVVMPSAGTGLGVAATVEVPASAGLICTSARDVPMRTRSTAMPPPSNNHWLMSG
jgi:hypothetical protein